jgi:hypothetical protein
MVGRVLNARAADDGEEPDWQQISGQNHSTPSCVGSGSVLMALHVWNRVDTMCSGGVALGGCGLLGAQGAQRAQHIAVAQHTRTGEHDSIMLPCTAASCCERC